MAKNWRAIRLAMWLSSPHCHWCYRKLKFSQTTIEHLRPRSHGGWDNTKNLAIACKGCNNRRGSIIDWENVGVVVEMTCEHCQEHRRIIASSSKECRKVWYGNGWRKYSGKWVCPTCAAKNRAVAVTK